MIKYYCDHNSCPFFHEGWCAYWDSTIELMQHRGVKCLMDDTMCYAINKMMMEGIHNE